MPHCANADAGSLAGHLDHRHGPLLLEQAQQFVAPGMPLCCDADKRYLGGAGGSRVVHCVADVDQFAARIATG